MATGTKMGALALAACLSVSALAACGSNNGASSAESSTGASGGGQAATEPKTEISISMYDRGEVVSAEGNYENNRWTKWINENGPAIVSWVPVPRNEAQTKLNTLIASGGAPDLIWEYDRNYIAQLANQGAIQPIDEYIEKYSTTFKSYLAEHPELKPYLMVNGKMYAVSSLRGVESVANAGMWIRQDWLDKLGLQAPTTTEEFFEVARKFKEADLDGNGKADTVPIVFNSNGPTVMRNLFAAHWGQWYLEDGVLEFGRISDRYMESMAFQKQLYDEGLLDQEYITDKSAQRATQLWTTGKAGIFLGSWDMESLFKDLKSNDPDAQMTALEPFTTKFGKNGLLQSAIPNILVSFNSKMKEDEIEAAVKFLDWMLETGWKPLRYGEENVHYKTVDGAPQIIDAEKFRTEVQYAKEYAVINQYELKPEWFSVMAATDELSQEYAKERANSLTVAMKNKFRRDIPYSPDLPELSQLIATFNPIAEQIEAKIVTGGSSMTAEAGMEEARKEWSRLGGDNVNKLANEWYQQNKAQLE
ncbi:extracellular solute-binding protein [Cohnella fermenti]|uniref:extracellular solute-binding protein n=1 Tax=Cohnella fermenti TaxID=2565925 RepID=UPI001E5F73F6|nr:extracellular solute-binding protein [Cohnella fermenti]